MSTCWPKLTTLENAPSGKIVKPDVSITKNYLKEFAETEFEKYRVIQERLFQSDFDRLMNEDDLLELPKSDK